MLELLYTLFQIKMFPLGRAWRSLCLLTASLLGEISVPGGGSDTAAIQAGGWQEQ